MIDNIKNHNGNIIPNLKVQNDTIVSYDTEVAIIDHKSRTIKAHKWYSQTTTRHIKAVAELYNGYAIVVVNKKDKSGWRK
tara:strand:- start:2345 stop:2584 length:240 start_codon:yes stop_codon:yes gene_type:complete